MDIDNIKKILQEAELKLIQKRNEDITKELKDAISKASVSKDELLQAISEIKITVPKADVPKAQVDVNIPEIKVPEVKVNIPEIKLPTINVPQPKVTVNVPEIKIPKIEIPEIKVPKIPKPEITVKVPKIEIPDLVWPKENMPIEGWVKLMGIDLNNPLPVQLRNPDGTLMRFPEITSSGGGSRGTVQTKKPENIHIDNIEMAVANTEYAHSLPGNTIAMTIQNRADNDMRVSYVIGRVANSTSAFMTVKGGQAYYETNVNLSGRTLYFASERTGTVEVISYD